MSKHLAKIKIPQTLILDFLDNKKVTVVPKSAKINNVYIDNDQWAIVMVLEHDSFQECREYEEAPYLYLFTK